MNNILILVRGYSPELSASGNLMKPLIEELGKNNKVFILSCASYNKKGNLTNNIKYEKLKVNPFHPGKFIRIKNFLQRMLIPSHHKKEIVSVFKKKIVELDDQLNFDIILAITYEEILALIYSKVATVKKRVFLLEKLPIESSIPILSSLSNAYKNKIESDIFTNTSRVFSLPIMHSYLSKKMHKDQLKKLLMLEHPMVINNINSKQDSPKEIALIYAGGLDRKQRNPKHLINFLNEVNALYQIKLVIYSYGNCQKYLEESQTKVNFLQSLGAIDSNSLKDEIHKANIIITIGNKENDIVPSKIFDCISTGKPIIHFSQSDEDPYYEYLSRYKNSIIIKYSENPSQGDINKVIQFIKKNKNTITNFDTIKNSFEECTPSFVANIITAK